MSVANHATDEQLVVFELAGELYGVDIGRVQEIDRMPAITKVPQVPVFVEGVINLRGRISPVVDLCTRLGLPRPAITPLTRIVVVKSEEEWVGMVVDGVSEVLRVPTSAIEAPSAMVTSTDSAFVRGIANLQERLIILLDLDRVLDRDFQALSFAAA